MDLAILIVENEKLAVCRLYLRHIVSAHSWNLSKYFAVQSEHSRVVAKSFSFSFPPCHAGVTVNNKFYVLGNDDTNELFNHDTNLWYELQLYFIFTPHKLSLI